jgi:endonuclease/exonuclease/phosphatase (EEP) superfamily protein YafD
MILKLIHGEINFIKLKSNNKCIQPLGDYIGSSLVIGNCDKKFNFDSTKSTSIKYNNLCIDVSGGINKDGTLLKLWNCLDKHPNQLFDLTNNNILWSINPNKCWDNLGGQNIIGIWTCLNNNNQLFNYEQDICTLTDSVSDWKSSNTYVGQNWCRGVVPIQGWSLKRNYQNINVNILSYNLYWWNLFNIRKGNGNSAGNLIMKSENKQAFDVMGFQECDDVKRILYDAKLTDKYIAINGQHAHGLIYNTIWNLLDKQSIDVGEDRSDQYFGKRIVSFVRLQHKLTKNTLFFVNHHGPLPVNTGGLCGLEAVAYNILKVIGKYSHISDSIVLVGDFNCNKNSITINILKMYMYHIHNSDSFGGVDHIFASSNSIVSTENLGTGGSDHTAIRASIIL